MTKFLRYLRGGQFYVQVNDEVAYVAVPNNGLSLVEVDAIYMPFLLSKRCGCCGEETKCFREATEDEVTKWKNGT